MSKSFVNVEAWITEAQWQATMVSDNVESYDDAYDASWSGFENLRTMIAESIPHAQYWQIQAIEEAYADTAASKFGYDHIRGIPALTKHSDSAIICFVQ